MNSYKTLIFCIPHTTLRFEATQISKKWDTKIYYEGKKHNATKVKNNLTTTELVRCVRALVSPAVFKELLKSKSSLSNFINYKRHNHA